MWGGSRARFGERGAALLLVLVVVVVVTLSGALAHRRALDTLREGSTALAVLRASEAARSGLTRATTGGPLAGSLPGGTSWVVTVDTTPSGDRIVRSVGTSSTPYRASSEALTLVDSTGKSVMSSVTVRR